MARPSKDNMDYFPHDTNAFSDTKIEKLHARHGIVGYGVFWYLLEKIYSQSSAILEFDDDFFLIAAKKIGIKKAKLDEIVKTLVDVGIFSLELYNQNKLSSDGIQKRFKPIKDKRLYNSNKYSNNGVSATETTKLKTETRVSDFNSGVSATKEKERKENIKENIKEKENKNKEQNYARENENLTAISNEKKIKLNKLCYRLIDELKIKIQQTDKQAIDFIYEYSDQDIDRAFNVIQKIYDNHPGTLSDITTEQKLDDLLN